MDTGSAFLGKAVSFSLRRLLLFVTLFALACLAFLQVPAVLLSIHSLITERDALYSVSALVVPFAMLASFGFLGWKLSDLTDWFFGSTLCRGVMFAVFLLLAMMGVYLLWVRCHLFDTWYSTTERNWIYGDQILTWYNSWLDTIRPAQPGTIKMHGELPAVWATIDLLLIGTISAWAFLCGVLLGKRSSSSSGA
jgi:hypothetical protein